MDWLKALAPTLAAALGGPLAGAAATFLAEKLGATDKTVEAVKEIITGNSLSADQLAQIKVAEIEFNKFLESNKIDLVKIHANDRADARKMQTNLNSVIPGSLAIGITVGFFGILSWMLSGNTPDSEALWIMLGSLGTAWTSIVAFYFGSSHGSDQKNKLLDRFTDRRK